MADRVLVVVAHPDDETLSMGGTIKRHSDRGDEVFAIAFTDGVGARDVGNGEAAYRLEAAVKASKILDFNWLDSQNFKDNEMDSHSLLSIVKEIECAKEKINPNIIYTHSAADLNIDHQLVSRAVLTAVRPQPNEHCREIRLFEVPSATDFGHYSITGQFLPNLFVNISQYWSFKERALACYDKEMRPYPHSRSVGGVENLAKLRGNQVGFEYCEAFEVVRKLVD
jgi:LmbE family N-acetylglucosaminyl deacetylase